jgi:excisionase family DNA binding protein
MSQMQVHNDGGTGVPLAELWTIQQVAEFLRVPVGTLYQWRHRSVGPPAFRVGRHLRYDAAAVRRWLLEEAA